MSEINRNWCGIFLEEHLKNLKKQVFLLLNYILDNLYRDDPKERRVRYLLPLHWLYDFCVEEEIDDLEGLELEQIQRFEKIVEQKVVNVKNSMQIIDNSRKILFLTAPEIHWHAMCGIWNAFTCQKIGLTQAIQYSD